ncbi:iron-sulfur cluster assembly scaffold protein [bacterium]|nr:iron-sulfur cluster assembly scaffold protein [bacterium]
MDDMRKELLAALGYSNKAIRMLDEELHYGELKNPTVHVKHQAGCGDILFLDLEIEEDRIRDAAFRFVGCSGLQASASGLTEMIIGRPVSEIEHLQMQDIVEWLEGIPENKYECAESASITLHKALDLWRTQQGSPAGQPGSPAEQPAAAN